jgi:hypothetical protein
MKRIGLFLALAAILTLGIAAQTTEVVPMAKVSIELPDDIQTTVDTGTWIGYSAENELTVMFDTYVKSIANKDLGEKTVAKACSDEGVKGFKFISLRNSKGLSFAYGRGTYTAKNGKKSEGIIGLLNNGSIKNKTFFFAFLLPSPADSDTFDAVVATADAMESSE